MVVLRQIDAAFASKLTDPRYSRLRLLASNVHFCNSAFKDCRRRGAMHRIAAAALRASECAAIFLVTINVQVGTPVADEIRTECKAVQKVASLTRSGKLMFSVASDEGKQYCHFFVSSPPPFTIHRGAVEAWCKEAYKMNEERLVQTVADLVVIAVPEGNEQTAKDARLRIGKNFDLIAGCTSKFLAKSPFSGKSDSGDVSCSVDKTADEATIIVAFGDFQSTLVLPRPA